MICNKSIFHTVHIHSTILHLLIFWLFYIDKVFLRKWEVSVGAIFCISARFGFPVICSGCFSIPFLIIAKSPVTTGIVTILICHRFFTSISRSIYLGSFSNLATVTFLPAGIFFNATFNSYVLLVCFDSSVCFYALIL